MAHNDLNASNISTNYTQMLGDMGQQLATAAADDSKDWSKDTLEQTRFIIQRIIVPCVVTIGIAGNLLTVIVLTR